MLGKLLKHDFKSTGKVLIPLNLLLVIVTIIGSVLLGTKILQRDEMLPLAIILLFTYILVLFAISIITSIFLVVSYYRNMFSSQGYLTFTLPASTWSIFNSKVITGFCWILVTTLLTFLSAITLIGSACGFENLGSVISVVFSTDLSSGSVNGATVLAMIGYTPMQFLLLMILMFLAACFYTISVCYGSVTIGQLYAKHKVVGAILAYVVIYFLVQIITSTFMMLNSFRSMFAETDIYASETGVADMIQSIYKPLFPTMILIYLVIGTACYVASVIILKKKVNLD